MLKEVDGVCAITLREDPLLKQDRKYVNFWKFIKTYPKLVKWFLVEIIADAGSIPANSTNFILWIKLKKVR